VSYGVAPPTSPPTSPPEPDKSWVLRHQVAAVLLSLGSLAVLLAVVAVIGAATSTTTTPHAGAASVLTAPVRIVHTPAGTVGYREVGTGTPLLLIVGADASMDYWPPGFVDALAAHHKVVVFDNAEVGRTTAVPGTANLTIPAMASQASALISALGLHRPAVLGWSMGGMIAQALAVRHPAQVSRLILAATAAGTGKAVPLQHNAAAAAPNLATILSLLFPKNQAAAARAYSNGIQQYPGFYRVSAATEHSQNLAVQQWLAGQDTAGPLVADIRVPTLVAGGTLDQFIAPANVRQLASSVPGARLLMYRDAGHDFLFQDAARFVRTVETFIA
jgi:pimeloyl-ACP methyl ester carboxylesterase